MGLELEKEELQHPQYKKDREVVKSLLEEKKDSNNGLAELARLKIRYRGFPGASDIKSDLEKVMNNWGLETEEMLFEKTRKIHAKGKVYRGEKDEQEDWM